MTLKTSSDHPALNRKLFPNLVIIGGTASGKTTVAYQLAKLIGFGVLDLDEWIEAKEGRSIDSIFKEDGVEAFRDKESQALEAIGNILNHVIIPGGGALERDENWERLRQLGPAIWLATPRSEVIYRLLQNPEDLRKRPLLAPALDITDREARRAYVEEQLVSLDARRMPRYQQADYAVTISFATAGTCAQFIKSLLVSQQVAKNA